MRSVTRRMVVLTLAFSSMAFAACGDDEPSVNADLTLDIDNDEGGGEADAVADTADAETDAGADTADAVTDAVADAPPACEGCWIDNLCYPQGVTDPVNVCRVCEPASSATSWSDNDGARCDDDAFCTVDDECLDGTCEGEARVCSDGVACNGTETCDEEGGACLPGEDQCDDDEVCDIA